jgi:hypothetical protein
MKNASFFFAATLSILFGFQTSLSAQKTATWKGGQAGRSSDWNCASNWKEGRVPDEFSSVVIPDISTSTFSFPIIEKGEVEIWSLQCLTGAHLTVSNKARLIILESAENGKTIPNQAIIASKD